MNFRRSFEKRWLKLRSRLHDPANLSLDEETLNRLILRNPSLTMEQDRLQEVADYHGLTTEEVLATQTMESRSRIKDAFQDNSTDAKLLDNYRSVSLLKIARMMTGYTRFGSAAKLLQHLNSIYPPAQRKNVKVLDYGCGASDYGLAFAQAGYSVTILDIEGGHLDFALWRFEQRKLPVKSIPVRADQVYPDLGEQNVIIAGEVFEHLRNPLQVLKNMYGALPVGGMLWYSGYPDYAREVGAEHLEEAGEQRLEALAYVRSPFEPGTTLSLPGCLYRKRSVPVAAPVS